METGETIRETTTMTPAADGESIGRLEITLPTGRDPKEDANSINHLLASNRRLRQILERIEKTCTCGAVRPARAEHVPGAGVASHR